MRVARSTGLKMFLILTLALLPLGVVALMSSLQAIRSADLEKEALLRLAASQSARKLMAELSSDQAALRLTVNTLAAGRADPQLCLRAAAFLGSRSNPDTLFAVYDRAGRKRCGSKNVPEDIIAPAHRFDPQGLTLVPSKSMLVTRTPSTNRSLVALAYYQRGYIDQITDPSTALESRHVYLREGDLRLDIGGSLKPGGSATTVSARLTPTAIDLVMAVRDPPVTLARTLSTFLPLFMWFAAAGIGWLVVNRLLIRPLVALNRVVAAYQPGEVIEPLKRFRTPAREISDLGNTFREISEDVATHEAEMEEGLARQRKLTREVHHRVKNNLQIIASLINLHARAATTPDAVDAYASIQRRVDALSVVHRNHYAELEENRGVGIRSLISELTASLRTTVTPSVGHFTIQLDSDHFHVSQDVAVPISFLITEVVELAMLIDPGTTIRISATRGTQDGRGQISLASPALVSSPAMLEHLDRRFGRVLTGLSRQLRSPLEYDEKAGLYCIDIPINA